MRRTVVSPAQRAEMRGDISGSDGLPESERVKGTIACQETGSRAQAYGVACREDPRDMAKAGLPESQSPEGVRSPPPERRLLPAPVPTAELQQHAVTLRDAGAMPCQGIEGAGIRQSRSCGLKQL